MNAKLRTDGNTRMMIEVLRNAPELMQALSHSMGEEALDLVREGFRQETDPYGSKWAEKKIPDGRKVLHGESSNLRLGWHIDRNASGTFRLAPSVQYAAVHQEGVDKMVTNKWGTTYRLRIAARRMIPSSGLGIPEAWRSALDEAAREAIGIYHSRITAGASGGMGMLTAKIAGLKQNWTIMAIIRRAFSESEQ